MLCILANQIEEIAAERESEEKKNIKCVVGGEETLGTPSGREK